MGLWTAWYNGIGACVALLLPPPLPLPPLQGWRKTMEDAHVTETDVLGRADSAVFGVFDGHGGAEVARFCERHLMGVLAADADFQSQAPPAIGCSLVRCFHELDCMMRTEAAVAELQTYKWREPNEPPAGAAGGDEREQTQRSIETTMAQAKEKGSLSKEEAFSLMMKMMMLKKMEAREEQGGGAGEAGAAMDTPALTAGCTAVVAVVRGQSLTVANAGDSRAVLCRDGKAVAMSEDHKPNDPIEIARIEKAGGHVNGVGRVNGNLNLSRAIGDQQYKLDEGLPPSAQIITAEPDIRIETLASPSSGANEFLIMACDGVWDVLSNQEAVDFVRERLPDGGARATPAQLAEICEAVMDRCLSPDAQQNGGVGTDNMTCLVVQFCPPQ